MAIVRVAVLVLYQAFGALLVAVLAALLWTLPLGDGFVHAFRVSLFVVGGLALLLGAVGVGGVSPSMGFVGGGGRIPGVRASAYVPPDGTPVNATALLLVVGAALVGIAFAV